MKKRLSHEGEPLITSDEKISLIYNELDEMKSRLDACRPLPPEIVKNLKEVYDIDWTYNSNAIEGNTLTYEETEMILKYGITVGGKTFREHLEAVNHRDAIDFVLELSRKKDSISEKDIKTIHDIILDKIDQENAGKYRKVPVIVGRDYLPPDFTEIPALMKEFALWLNSEEVQRLHPIERAILAHCKFLNIHPFVDGNGRTARLLMNLILIREGFPPTVIQNKYRKDYISAMRRVNRGDFKKIREEITNELRRSLDRYLLIAEGWKKGIIPLNTL